MFILCLYIYLFFDRIEHPLEFEQVRKLAAEILGKFPPSLSICIIEFKLNSLRSTTNFFACRSYIYVICHMIVVHGVKASDVLHRLLDSIFHFLVIPVDIVDTLGKIMKKLVILVIFNQ